MVKDKDKETEMLTTDNDQEPVVTQDEKINAVGSDVKTVEPPKAPAIEKKSEAKVAKADKPLELEELRIALQRLAARVMPPAEYEIIRQSFPRIFR